MKKLLQRRNEMSISRNQSRDTQNWYFIGSLLLTNSKVKAKGFFTTTQGEYDDFKNEKGCARIPTIDAISFCYESLWGDRTFEWKQQGRGR
jgi:hypothetical protein